jgi:hypothetical protein
MSEALKTPILDSTQSSVTLNFVVLQMARSAPELLKGMVKSMSKSISEAIKIPILDTQSTVTLNCVVVQMARIAQRR